MINNNIMQIKIELANLKTQLKNNEIKIKRLFWEIQNLANPFYKEIEDIKAEEMVQCAEEMSKLKEESLKVEKTIKEIKKQLGED